MQAIILAVGRGKRTQYLANKSPKPCIFIEVQATTIIRKTLDNLVKMGINNVLIEVGYLKEYVYQHLGKKYKNINIEYLEVKDWENTNNSYGIYLAKDYIDDDFLIIEGDEYFSEPFISKQLLGDENNYWLGTKQAVTGCLLFTDDTDRLVNVEIIRDFAQLPPDEDYYKSCGVLKITKKDKDQFFDGLGKFLQADEENKKKYVDNYLQENLEVFAIKVLPLSTDIIWGEIDDRQDLEKLEKQLANFNQKQRNKYWNDFKINHSNSDLLYHLAGADKDISRDDYKIPNKQLIYYYYRFLLEEQILADISKRNIKNAARVLDAGSGTGRNSLLFSKYFQTVDSFDISQVFIEANQKRFSAFKNINFFTADTTVLAKLDKKYDLIFFGGVFMCMSYSEIQKALEDVKKLLTDDGILLVRDTLSRSITKYHQSVKIYRSEKDYEAIFANSSYQLIKKFNSASRNIWCSLFLRLPKVFQERIFIFKFFQKLIKLFIKIDLQSTTKQPFHRHRLSNQLFYIFKK